MSEAEAFVISSDEESEHPAGEARTPAQPKSGSVVVIGSSPEDDTGALRVLRAPAVGRALAAARSAGAAAHSWALNPSA